MSKPTRILAPPRLRFDKVALNVIGRLRDSLSDSVPDGKTLVLTISAPIRVAAKTARALEDLIRTHLARRAARWEIDEVIHGNHVRIRLVKAASKQTAKVIAFVHNPGPDAGILLDMTQSLLESLSDGRLVLVDGGASSRIETYRHIYAQISVPKRSKKISIAFAGGQIEELAAASRP